MPNEMDLLKTIIERGFDDSHRRMDDINRRLDANEQVNVQRHESNTKWMGSMDQDLRRIDRTTTEHTADIKTLFARGIPVTVIGLRWYLGFSVAAIGVLVAALHVWK